METLKEKIIKFTKRADEIDCDIKYQFGTGGVVLSIEIENECNDFLIILHPFNGEIFIEGTDKQINLDKDIFKLCIDLYEAFKN